MRSRWPWPTAPRPGSNWSTPSTPQIGLAPDRRALRAAGTGPAVAGGEAEPCGRGGHGRRPRGRARTGRRPPRLRSDWPQIAELYAQLVRVLPSPVARLNHAVAVAMADGPAAGLELVDALHASDRTGPRSPSSTRSWYGSCRRRWRG